MKVSSPTGTATVIAVSNEQTGLQGYGCNLQEGNGVVVVQAPTCTTVQSGLVPAPAGAHDAFVRLFLDDLGTTVTAACRVDLGFSAGITATKGCDRNLTGNPGVLAAGEDVTVDAIAIVRTQPGETCATVRR